MSLYAGAARERLIELNTALVKDPPARNLPPHFFVSPRTPDGQLTEGIAFTLIKPSQDFAVGTGGDLASMGSGDAGGFNVTLWRAVLATGGWASLAPFTTHAVYGEQYVLEDVSGAWGMYIQIGGTTRDGRLLVGIAELG